MRLMNCALVAKLVDAQDLKSCGNYYRAGSTPARGTTRFNNNHKFAGVAQLVERQPSKLNVASSTLVSRSIIYEPLAQSVEHLTFNQGVTGSIPVWLTILFNRKPDDVCL